MRGRAVLEGVEQEAELLLLRGFVDAEQAEAMAKRRVGLGFTGLGDALVMLGLLYLFFRGTRLGLAMRATTGLAPVPVPPPMPQVTNTRSALASTRLTSSRFS